MDICSVMLLLKSIEDKLSVDIGFEKRFSSQINVLVYILFCGKDSIEQKAIEEKFSIDKATLTNMLNRFEKKRYIKREIDERDRRHRIIKLDKFGEGAREKLILKTDFINNGLTEKEFKNFEHVMIKISKAML